MNARQLYGTDQPPPHRKILSAGKASVTLENGQLRHLRVGEAEAIRAVSFLVRDRDWGTVDPAITDLQITAGDATRVSYTARYTIGSDMLETQVTLTLAPDRLDAEAVAIAHGDVQTNRAGFTVLHPINGVAGAPVEVEHADGSLQKTRFPSLIAPWQPFMNIRALTHSASGLKITCEFEGDVFEMEDQRQWGDASYKTYNRPLALPWPYMIANGEQIRQAVRLRWQAARTQAPIPAMRPRTVQNRFPQTALLLDAEQARRAATHPADLRGIGPQRLLCHLDTKAGHGLAELVAFADLQNACPDHIYDLELIAACPPDGDLSTEFSGYAADLAQSGLKVASIMVCPSVDRQSTPPGSDWPACPALTDIHAAARATFPTHIIGGGMVSFFPELNRKPPPVHMLDFVSHGLNPIIHAADDISVMETLEAVPHILASARAMIGGAEYRLGPSTIAMRHNPYGSRTIPNPRRERICMAEDDPRQDGDFAAVWLLGLAANVARANVAVWTPAELYGPRGLIRDDGSTRPVASMVAALSRHAGQPVRAATVSAGSAQIDFDGVSIIANLTPGTADDLPPFGWQSRLGSSTSS